MLNFIDINFLQTGLEKITSNPYKIVTSVYKYLKRYINLMCLLNIYKHISLFYMG